MQAAEGRPWRNFVNCLRLLAHSRRGRRARRAIAFTLLALVCFRIGYYVLWPGTDARHLFNW
jgi:hypothetical protein